MNAKKYKVIYDFIKYLKKQEHFVYKCDTCDYTTKQSLIFCHNCSGYMIKNVVTAWDDFMSNDDQVPVIWYVLFNKGQRDIEDTEWNEVCKKLSRVKNMINAYLGWVAWRRHYCR